MTTEELARTGGPAFPQPPVLRDDEVSTPCNWDEGGMSLLDWFAGQALTGLLATSCNVTDSAGHRIKESPDFASAAFNYAEAMLAEKARRDQR